MQIKVNVLNVVACTRRKLCLGSSYEGLLKYCCLLKCHVDYQYCEVTLDKFSRFWQILEYSNTVVFCFFFLFSFFFLSSFFLLSFLFFLSSWSSSSSSSFCILMHLERITSKEYLSKSTWESPTTLQALCYFTNHFPPIGNPLQGHTLFSHAAVWQLSSFCHKQRTNLARAIAPNLFREPKLPESHPTPKIRENFWKL